MRLFLLQGFGLSALLLLLPACGADGGGESGTSSGAPSDGRYHPPGDGQRISEGEACSALRDALTADRLALGCAGTSRSCPDLLRYEFQTTCLEYDQGSVKGCLTYYKEAKSCPDLNKAASDCVVTPFPESAPAGCPTK